MDLTAVYRKCNNFVEKKIGEELVLVPLTNNVADMNKVFTLNEVGTFIYNKINSVKTLSEILSELVSEFEVGHDVASQDLKQFIEISVLKGVIEKQV